MNHRLILIATLIVLAAVAMLTQKHVAHSAASTVPLPAAPAEFSGSTDKTFDQLMGDSMSVMNKGMHSALPSVFAAMPLASESVNAKDSSPIFGVTIPDRST
jgi:hypothetical protein